MAGENNIILEPRNRPKTSDDNTSSGILDIRSYYYPALIRHIADLADEGWIPTVTDAQSLICIMTEQVADRWNIGEDIRVEKPIPWPDKIQRSGQIVSDDLPYYSDENRKIIASSKILGDIVDTGEPWEGINSLLPTLVINMTDASKAELGIWLLDNMTTFNVYYQGMDTDKIGQLFRTIAAIDPYSPGAMKVGERFARFLRENIGERGVLESLDFEGYGSSEQWFLYSATNANMQVPLYRYLSTKECPEEQRNYLMGIFLRSNGVARELNTMRSMLHSGRLPKGESDSLEETLRSILGLLADKPVHTNLSDLYAAIKFEEYQVGKSMQSEITNTAIALLEKYHVSHGDSVLELGSGTGWLTNELRKIGIDAHGIDASERNVAVSQEMFGGYFEVGNWEHINVAGSSQKAVLSLGRSLPHTEEEDTFYNVLAQVSKVLAYYGVFVFDMPDSTQGGYWENVQRYRAVLRKFGFTEAELKNQWIIVDSPDGQHFYNRFVPPLKRIRAMLNNMAFAVREVILQDIPNDKGDKNIAFVAEKLEHPIWEDSSQAD